MSTPTFTSLFRQLPPLFFEEVEPTPLQQAQLAAVSRPLAQEMNLQVSDDSLLAWLNGDIRWPGDQRIATRYAGHQFGVWAGQLGDGRAISLGEAVVNGKIYEVQTKGSGITPFSRMGDGKAVIRSSVREFLGSEAMHFLGVPSTRALALLVGEDPVQRETVEKSAIVARVFPSNLRFGHFEYAYHFGHSEELKKLVEFSRLHFFPETSTTTEFLLRITELTARLMARWQSIGFSHGVMNTDNLSILGLTIDYGPFGFMENYDPAWICNHSDHQGRYSFQNQPYIGLWNLDRLMQCFSMLLSEDELREILKTYEPHFWDQYFLEFMAKLGLESDTPAAKELVVEWLALLQNSGADFTHSFRHLPEWIGFFKREERQRLPEFLQSASAQHWLTQYSEHLNRVGIPEDLRKERQNLKNPKFVLRNYIAQEIIKDVEQGDFQKLHQWQKILENPYAEHPAFEAYSLPTPLHLRDFKISCSS